MAMSPSETGTLVMAAADDATEIFLMDASLHRLASGLGTLKKEVPLGVYKVRFRSGASQHDELVEVASRGSHVNVQAPLLMFRTAAPIDATLTTHEYQSDAASSTSNRVHVNAGSGGELFVFVREEDDSQAFTPTGLTIHSLGGKGLAQLEAGEWNQQGRWAALNVRLDPGTYCIRVVSGHLGAYEIFATVCQGWQTQVFQVMGDFWRERESIRAPSLRFASILMARQGQGFRPGSRTVRLAELARQALAQGRDVISSQLMNELLQGKFNDPMLGIIAAHLLRQRPRPDRELLSVVTGNLLNLFGEHPDVQALLVAGKGLAGRRIEAIERPPTLRLSWDHIVKASRRRASLVPPDSPVGRIADEVVTGGPWLIHRLRNGREIGRTDKPSIAEATRVVEKLAYLGVGRLREMARRTSVGEENLSGLERGVLGAAMSYAKGLQLKAEDEEKSRRSRARQMLGDLSAPSYSIANAVVSLANKMDLGGPEFHNGEQFQPILGGAEEVTDPREKSGIGARVKIAPRDQRKELSKKLFVGSLSWNTDHRRLRQAFAPYGRVIEAEVVTSRETGRSKGFGFVTFADDEAAERAIGALNDSELDGRTIRVNLVGAKSSDGAGKRKEKRHGGGKK